MNISERGDGSSLSLLIGTRKGAFILRSNAGRRIWTLSSDFFLGHIVHHLVQDPREPTVLLMAARTGHLGPTVFRSTDQGIHWTEARIPPAFPKASNDRAVDHVFWLTPGHVSEPGVWYAGTSPPGLYRTEDGGATWEGVPGFNDHPMWRTWVGSEKDAPPGGSKLHSILIDPRHAAHMYLSLSTGGFFESVDTGKTWTPLNQGCAADFIPTPDPVFGHDPHCAALHPLMPDRLYQQNHCGIYRMDRPDGRWIRIGDNMPAAVGDIGFPIALHPRDPDTVWVFPMDGTDVWPRTSPGGRPAVYGTRDAGKTWTRQDQGLPSAHAWFSVKRQAMTTDSYDPAGVYFGTTNGEVWGSADEGTQWSCLVRYLPEVYSLETAETQG